MKIKLTTRICRSLIMLMAVAVLFSFSLPISAGSVKKTGNQNEQPRKIPDNSGAMIAPKPVADDSPINPASGNEPDSTEKNYNRDHLKKKSRH
jgi:hypothetical protein